MFNLTDPFQPQQGVQTPQQGPDLATQWSTALNDPNVRTALLQFGISMLQPPSWGDTFGSQFGRAVGAAGEAVSNREQQNLDEEQKKSQIKLREAQAKRAGSGTGLAAERLGVEQSRLGLAQDKFALSKIVAAANARSRHFAIYQREKAAYDQNKAYGIGDTSKPFPSFDQWQHENGLDTLYGGGGSGTNSSTYPTAVRGQMDRVPGNYNIPGRGVMYWDGYSWYPERSGGQ